VDGHVLNVRVIIPVLGRPERADAVIRSLDRSSLGVGLLATFVANEDDHGQIAAARATGADVLVIGKRTFGDYARKINAAVAATDEEWFFTAADDVCFCRGWAEEALKIAEQTSTQVIGTNDLARRVHQYATHFLVNRAYVALGTIDEPGVLFHEGYDHNYVDTEFIGTAKARGLYAYARNSRVEHLHPFWKKAPTDATYALGRKHVGQDAKLFRRRQPLWMYRSSSARSATRGGRS